MSHTLRPLILAAACLLFGATQAEARQPYRYYYPRPIYTQPRQIAPGVYVYPQVVTTPVYTMPYYAYPYYPSWYGGYVYTPGYYGYRYTPWGNNYYYTNPRYNTWYWIR
jgi:hypothetical protein